MVFLFCAYRDWSIKLYEKLSKKYDNFILLNSPKKLTFSFVKKLNPEFIFFPDWSWIIPEKITSNYKCVCLHESNLPKFRGGSPLQNQIIRGITKTKTTAFFMSKGIDEGDIILQQDLSLSGRMDEIFLRMIENDFKIIEKIILGNYKLTKQKGRRSIFKRRKPEESELDSSPHSLEYFYNFIRMLDDPYPNAFIRLGDKKVILKNPQYKNGKITFNGEIV
jgi:methionyl-tRNA formyltransferase|tara:strand:+ start:1428 stop:2090 length:663 start_codon:yes stop_codon:yes gene_type:complete